MNIVKNEVYKYRVSFAESLEISIYINPFPELIGSEEEMQKECERREELVKEKYFTKEKIDELKKIFIKLIEENENPFYIYCYDTDSNYNVTAKELTKI